MIPFEVALLRIRLYTPYRLQSICEVSGAAYVACVLTILLYGSECWALTKRMRAKLATFHNMAARVIYGCQWRHVREQHITTVTVLKETGLRHIDTYAPREAENQVGGARG